MCYLRTNKIAGELTVSLSSTTWKLRFVEQDNVGRCWLYSSLKNDEKDIASIIR